MGINVFWFRKDLRLDDNVGFNYCIKEQKPVLPVFVVDNSTFSDMQAGKKKALFLIECLKSLERELKEKGSKLYLFNGHPVDIMYKISKEVTIDSIIFNRCYEPLEINTEREIWDEFTNLGIHVKSYKDLLLHERGDILKKDKTSYSVFSYYYKKWRKQEKESPKNTGDFETVQFHTDSYFTLPENQISMQIDVEKELAIFLDENLKNYQLDRDFPYKDATSKLSCYLNTGKLSIRRLYNEVLSKGSSTDTQISDSAEAFLRQLAWRDFYHQILYHFPHVETSAFHKRFNSINWENDNTLFDKWCAGKTGFPFVDAGMRQLNQEGWMHNRLRMIVASFLVKDLFIDWRWGEDYFSKKLIDHDLALNNGGWQWSASTGTDSQPWFRIFNPYSQSKRFDPEGIFIRKFVPELTNVNNQYIHQPDQMPLEYQKECNCLIGKDYPEPIVNHAKRREMAYRRKPR